MNAVREVLRSRVDRIKLRGDYSESISDSPQILEVLQVYFAEHR